ncbi:nucleotidyl transferase AbiEii/AbiGii toxin family protein [Pseudonocardia sp. T1-2H]|uniref:nucleotidyl transferase AbiEii/AbiGii toxin family protein n=1 Tax=Pseudonocardia sp. T1-2H TaxID=3128899 RepID=UPI0031016358
MWAAVQSRSRNTAKLTGATTNNVARQFVYDRFLARLFTHVPDGTWVLKGGTALLARVRSARHSRDIDLFRSAGTLDTALDELRSAARLDLHDHLRFVLQVTARLGVFGRRPWRPLLGLAHPGAIPPGPDSPPSIARSVGRGVSTPRAARSSST